ncbi:MAG: glycosyltransferase family 2 protein [Clostridia bacterium]|nr:glycosyltransferase family 2 protein [Clostridia bacterium]
MKISLIVPCYNEENNIEPFYNESEKVFCKSGYELEYVFVNDGSCDLTAKNLKKLCNENNSNFRIISFARNFGKEAAIYAGLSYASGDYICIIDADLQQRPEYALQMANILDKEPDIDCVGAYPEKRKEFFVKALFKNVFYKLINLVSETPFKHGVSDFRMFRTNVKDAILQMKEYHRFSKGIFAWVGFENKYIPYKVMERKSGKTKWSFIKLCKYAINGITDYSAKPLYLSSVLGGLFATGGFAYYIVALVIFLMKKGYSPNALICATVFFVGGVVLGCIGITGAYLVKMYFQVKQRPIYITKEIIEKEKE